MRSRPSAGPVGVDQSGVAAPARMANNVGRSPGWVDNREIVSLATAVPRATASRRRRPRRHGDDAIDVRIALDDARGAGEHQHVDRGIGPGAPQAADKRRRQAARRRSGAAMTTRMRGLAGSGSSADSWRARHRLTRLVASAARAAKPVSLSSCALRRRSRGRHRVPHRLRPGRIAARARDDVDMKLRHHIAERRDIDLVAAGDRLERARWRRRSRSSVAPARRRRDR